MMKLLNLFPALLFLLLTSCLDTPGIEEPSIFICHVRSDDSLHCVHTMNPSLIKDIPSVEAIGFECIDPRAYATLKTHHEALHLELNSCRRK
jgi:hypothetical protein